MSGLWHCFPMLYHWVCHIRSPGSGRCGWRLRQDCWAERQAGTGEHALLGLERVHARRGNMLELELLMRHLLDKDGGEMWGTCELNDVLWCRDAFIGAWLDSNDWGVSCQGVGHQKLGLLKKNLSASKPCLDAMLGFRVDFSSNVHSGDINRDLYVAHWDTEGRVDMRKRQVILLELIS